MGKHDEGEIVKFVLRVPRKSHTQLKKGADANNLSMNQLICNIISDRFSLQKHTDSQKLDIIIEMIEGWSDADTD